MAASTSLHPPRTSLRDVAWHVAAHGVLPITSLLTGPLLARALGPSGRGTLAAVTAPLFLASVVAVMAVPEAATYAIGRLGRSPRAVWRASVLLAGLYGLVAAVAVWSAAPALLRGNPQAVGALRAVSWCLPLLSAGLAARSVAFGLRRYALVNTERIVAAGGRLLALAVLAAAGALTVGTAVSVQVVTTVAGTALLWWGLRAALRRPSAQRAREVGVGRDLARYGVLGWGGVSANLVTWRLDQVLLAAFVGPSTLAFYAIAANLAELPAMALGAAKNVVFAESARHGDLDQLRQLSGVVIWTTVGTCLVGAVLAVPVVRLLFGDDFAGAVSYARILLLATIPFVAEQVLATGLLSSGRPGRRSLGQMVAAVVTVTGLVLLIPRFGAAGAAWTSVVAYTVAFLVTGRALSAETGMPVRRFVAPPSIAVIRGAALRLLRSRGGSG